MTLADLIETLATQANTTPLVFETSDGPIRAGYHLTEFRHAAFTGFACDGVKENWEEAFVQLMDGSSGDYMTAERFLKIAQKTVHEMPEIAELPIQVEFGSHNASRSLFTLGAPQFEDGKITFTLNNTAVACKAMVPRANAEAHGGCCSSACGR